MWHAISKNISDKLHFNFVIQNKHQVSSNADHPSFKISDNHHQYFVKLGPSSYEDNFECEAFNLKELTNESLFFVPDCICTGKTLSHSYIVLEWLD